VPSVLKLNCLCISLYNKEPNALCTVLIGLRTRDSHCLLCGTNWNFRPIHKIAKGNYWLRHVCLSVRTEQLSWVDFREMWLLSIFRKSVQKIRFHYNLTPMTDTLPEDQYKFLIISLSVLLRMRNISDTRCRGNQNIHFMFNNLFIESRACYEIMWTYFLEPGRQYMIMWGKSIAGWIHKATNTHSGYVILIAFPLQHWFHERASVLH